MNEEQAKRVEKLYKAALNNPRRRDRAMMDKYLALHPVCERCGEPAKRVHHIKPFSMGGDESFKNLMALCTECHNYYHQAGYEVTELGKLSILMNRQPRKSKLVSVDDILTEIWRRDCITAKDVVGVLKDIPTYGNVEKTTAQKVKWAQMLLEEDLSKTRIALISAKCACANCGSTESVEAHYVVPLNRGGNKIAPNTIYLCQRCRQLIPGKEKANKNRSRKTAKKNEVNENILYQLEQKDTLEILLECIEQGCSQSMASKYAGVSAASASRLLKKAREENTIPAGHPAWNIKPIIEKQNKR